MFEITYKRSAVKSLGKIPKPIRERMIEPIEAIAADPKAFEGDWKSLIGSPYWRLRIGGYRAIINIQDNKLMLLVIKVGPRGDVYK